MTTAYLTRVAGAGTTAEPYRPAIDPAATFVCLLIDPAKDRALIVSNTDTLTGTGVNSLLTAADYPALLVAADQFSPNAARRTAVNNWLASGEYAALPADATTWRQVIDHAAGQANPGASLATTYLAPAP